MFASNQKMQEIIKTVWTPARVLVLLCCQYLISVTLREDNTPFGRYRFCIIIIIYLIISRTGLPGVSS